MGRGACRSPHCHHKGGCPRAQEGHPRTPLRSCSRPGMREGSQPSTTSGPPRETENTGESPESPKRGNLNLPPWQQFTQCPTVPGTVSHLEMSIKYTRQCAQLYVRDLSTQGTWYPRKGLVPAPRTPRRGQLSI